MSWVVWTNSKAGELVLHSESFFQDFDGLGGLVLALCNSLDKVGVSPALWFVTVCSANQKILGVCLSQNPDVVLTFILKKNNGVKIIAMTLFLNRKKMTLHVLRVLQPNWQGGINRLMHCSNLGLTG